MSTELLDRQNADGGWGFRGQGSSWTEPTGYALLSLAASGLEGSEGFRRGVRWLQARQRADGGWAPREGVDQSTWVTALVLLLPMDVAKDINHASATAWLLAETGRESSFLQRLRWRLLGVPLDSSQAYDGWPWYPGAAAWVAPTSVSLLALRKMAADDAAVRARIEQGRGFLLARRCRDGGWNHGSTRALGYDSGSYPETTGLAVLALQGSPDPAMAEALPVAERHLARCTSLEAASWLTLGLLAWGRKAPLVTLQGKGGTVETAVAGLARAAAGGRNIFLQ